MGLLLINFPKILLFVAIAKTSIAIR